MSRFVLLRHDSSPQSAEPSHWDLMLESDGALLTWRLMELPQEGEAICAERLPDHRLLFLDYEGPVSGDRGEVRRVDAGEFTWHEHAPRRIRIDLAGALYSGSATIHAVEGNNWLLQWTPSLSGA